MVNSFTDDQEGLQVLLQKVIKVAGVYSDKSIPVSCSNSGGPASSPKPAGATAASARSTGATARPSQSPTTDDYTIPKTVTTTTQTLHSADSDLPTSRAELVTLIRSVIREELAAVPQAPSCSAVPKELGVSDKTFMLASLEPTPSKMVRSLMDAMFTMDDMRRCSFSGSKANRHEAKEKLNPDKVDSIFAAVFNKFPDANKPNLKAAVQNKLCDVRRVRVAKRPYSTPHASPGNSDDEMPNPLELSHILSPI